MKYNYTLTSQTIRVAREKKGLTQSDLAKEFGYSTSQFISNTERGICLFPVKSLKKLSKTLNVPLKKLVDNYLDDVANQTYLEVGMRR